MLNLVECFNFIDFGEINVPSKLILCLLCFATFVVGEEE